MTVQFIPLISRTFTQMGAFDNTVNTIGAATSLRRHYLDPLVVRVTNSTHDTDNTAWGNVVTNGVFGTNVDNWTASGSTVTRVSSAMLITNSGAAEGFARGVSMTTVAGSRYSVRFTSTGGTANAIRAQVGSAVGGAELVNQVFEQPENSDIHEVIFTAADVGSWLTFGTASTTNGQTAAVDNIEVHRIPTEAELGTMALFVSSGVGKPWKLQAGGKQVIQYANNANNNITAAVTTLFPNYVYTDGALTQRPA